MPRLIAFDLETTGLNPLEDQILQLGAVVFDTDGYAAEFSTLCKQDRYEGDAYALQMNAKILYRLATEKHPHIRDALINFELWAEEQCKGERLSPVGFNVAAFDLLFWATEKRRHLSTPNAIFSHRPIELGSLLAGSDGLPTSSNHAVKSILDKPVSHDALEDVRDARRLYLHWYETRRLR